MKCKRCGEIEEATRMDGQSQLCLACHLETEDRNYTGLILSYVSLVIAGFLLLFFLPQLSLGVLLLNICAVLAFVLASTIIHEFGHVLAGRSVGFRIFAVEIGWGRVVAEFFLWKMRMRFRSILFGGFVRGVPKEIRHYRLRESIFIMGGPLANALLIWLGFELLWIDEVFESGLFQGFIPVRMLMLSNAVMLIYSLFPHEMNTQHGKSGNDMLLLWRTWRQPETQFRELPTFYHIYESEYLQSQKQFDKAKECIEAGLESFRGCYYLELAEANNLLASKRYSDARRAYVLLLGRYGKHADIRSLLFNSIAWTNLMSGDLSLLPEADACSRLALEQMREMSYFKGTRGSILVELGQFEEGLRLLYEAVKSHPERSGQAQDVCCIGIAERKRGNLQKSRAYFKIARSLDPKCDLLNRELETH